MDSALRSYILLRDQGCVARFANSAFHAFRWPMLQGLPEPGQCRNEFGSLISAEGFIGFTLDHVKAELRMGVRAEDHPDRIWTLCAFHHGLSQTAGMSWATMAPVREAARLYIAEANAQAQIAGFPPFNPVWWAAP